ncbi:MAG TPA: hypothetical protein V6D48_01440 [Oculatellaceae cyanobacterium]
MGHGAWGMGHGAWGMGNGEENLSECLLLLLMWIHKKNRLLL